ncbi:MAG: RNA polymerase sigma factor [Pseudomonadota bacterium]
MIGLTVNLFSPSLSTWLDSVLCSGDNRQTTAARASDSRVTANTNLQNLDDFLAAVESRAYRMAYIATGDRDDALDLVQDAMCKLVEKYADKSPGEWGGLFHRILQSKIRDRYRRIAVRNRFRQWLGGGEDRRENELEQFATEKDRQPGEQADSDASMQTLDVALHRLPFRQQQAFLLRAWEGLSTAETAVAMDCSEGSVKTHYSRAVHTLRGQLEHYHD